MTVTVAVAGGGSDVGIGVVGKVEHAIIPFTTNNEGLLIVGTSLRLSME